MDVEQVCDELYGVAPDEFVAARDARTAEARKSGDAAGARRIAALRRPTLAAWASNRFVRERPEDAQRLLALGETLREATRLLDAAKLREAAGVRNKVIAAEVREAAAVAEAAGHPLSAAVRQEVEQLLRAVLADADIAAEWSSGRLVKPPQAPVGFAAITPEAVPPRPAPPDTPTAGGEAEEEAASEAAAARKVAEEEARKAAEAAAEAARAEARRRDEELRAAEARATEADAEVTSLEERLREAKSDLRTARKAAKDAATAAREAHRAADAAGRDVPGRG